MGNEESEAKIEAPETAGSPGTGVRLSLCMIVKNEEKNIGKAISWAKNITYEQIVVDTGSTDSTVKLAEEMGAKVYHFEWVDDFSAARNYAIDQASGNWIAVFDADEYMTPEDAGRLLGFLCELHMNPEMSDKYKVLLCQLLNIDDDGKPMSRYSAMRIFRNVPEIHYAGSVHEHLLADPNSVLWVDDIKIIHTGYSKSAYKEKNKTERNIKILRTELTKNPEDMYLKAYLADTLRLRTDNKSRAEAEALFAEVLESGADINRKLRIKAYVFFLDKYINDPEMLLECEQLCRNALAEFPESLDFGYFLASVMNYKGDYNAAWDLLKAGEEKLEGGAVHGDSVFVPADPTMLYGQLILAAQGLGDVENVIKYASLILIADKNRQDILGPLIAAVLRCGAMEEELIGLLSSIYNMGDSRDLLLIARAATDCGAIELARKIMDIASANM